MQLSYLNRGQRTHSFMLTGKEKRRDIVWRQNSIKINFKNLNSEYNSKHTTNKNEQITKRTPKCTMTPNKVL